MSTPATRKPYPSDVSDEEWHVAAPYLALVREDAPQRRHDLREVFNGLRWLVRTGAEWRMLPHDFPRWDAVYQQTRRWLDADIFAAIVHDLRILLRLDVGRRSGQQRQPPDRGHGAVPWALFGQALLPDEGATLPDPEIQAGVGDHLVHTREAGALAQLRADRGGEAAALGPDSHPSAEPKGDRAGDHMYPFAEGALIRAERRTAFSLSGREKEV
jgi:transposase